MPVSNVPVLVNHQEHYQLLCEIIEHILAIDSDSSIILRMQMPAGGRMPKLLLDDRILMVQDVEIEESLQSKCSNRTVWVLDDRIIRYPLEAGDNSLSIRIHNPADADSEKASLEDLLTQRCFCATQTNPAGGY